MQQNFPHLVLSSFNSSQEEDLPNSQGQCQVAVDSIVIRTQLPTVRQANIQQVNTGTGTILYDLKLTRQQSQEYQ